MKPANINVNSDLLIKKLNEVIPLINAVINVNVSQYEKVKRTIIQTVCDNFMISEDELYNGTSQGERVDAVAVTCVCFRYYLKMSYLQLSNEFKKRDKSSIAQYFKRLKALDPKIPQDKQLINKIRIIKTSLEQQIFTT
jgi:chromosomal replication initiation ATPase DnaA